MSALEPLREKQKQLFRTLINTYNNSPQFTSTLCAKLGGDGYKVVQYDSKYKHQSLQILAYQFSSMGGTNHAKIIMLSVADHYNALSLELDHLHKTGTGSVVVDKWNNVCMISYFWDYCDQPMALPPSQMHGNYRKKYEICRDALKNDKVFQSIISQQNVKYGDVVLADKLAIRPDLVGKGVFWFESGWLIYAGAALGYKYLYTLHTHPKTIVFGDEVPRIASDSIVTWRRTSHFDFSDFKFENGSTVSDCYKQLRESGFNVNKLNRNDSTIGVMIASIQRKLTPTETIHCWWMIQKRVRSNYRSKSKL